MQLSSIMYAGHTEDTLDLFGLYIVLVTAVAILTDATTLCWNVCRIGGWLLVPFSQSRTHCSVPTIHNMDCL